MNPADALERTLRAGPPDESGYRALPIDLAPAMVERRRLEPPALAPIQAVPFARVVAARRAERVTVGSSWRGAAAFVLVAIALVTAGIVTVSNRAGVGGRPAAGIAAASLTETFDSTRNGFSIRHPAGWNVTPATAAWPHDSSLPNGHPALDRLELPGAARLVVASQVLGVGQTEDEWLAAFFQPYPRGNPCPSDRAGWPRVPVDGVSAYLALADCPTGQDDKVAERDISFEALAFDGGRVYQFRFNGDVDRQDFENLLSTVRLEPSRAVD